jgi:vacuolar-type H+-ATPase subunit F/Vma7
MSATRIIALGSAALMDGFRLAGIEVVPDAGRDQLEELLKSLLSGKDKALVLVEDALTAEPGPWLHRALTEGGRVVVVQVPSLARAGEYHPDVDRLIGYAVHGDNA